MLLTIYGAEWPICADVPLRNYSLITQLCKLCGSFTQLHILYSSLTRSKLDYCCVVYGSARASYHKMLDPIHNRALRLCLGAFRTSPAISLCVEATEPPLAVRRKKLSLQYCLKLSANTNNLDVKSSLCSIASNSVQTQTTWLQCSFQF